MFDSHCHLDVPAFTPDLERVLGRAAEAGVHDVLVPAIRPSTFAELLRICRLPLGPFPRRHVALGIHPQVVPELSEPELAELNALPQALQNNGAVAVGECGLDGPTGAHEQQEAIFRTQIRTARDLQLPIILHAFRTHEIVLRILKEERARDVGGVAHSFSGSAQLVPRYTELGFSISFAGAVTWERARKVHDAAAAVPDDFLLAETDGPDQAPAPLRGQRTEPAAITHVIHGLAVVRGQTDEYVKRLTTANARRLFRLAPSSS